jgi:potassium efflux system protein
VNFVLTVSWYESIFVAVLVGYLVLRGLLIEAMAHVSTLVIRHVNNGWLWTEAFLKPLDRVLRTALLVGSGLGLFILYGWNQQSAVVRELTRVLTYPLATLFNAHITILSIFEVALVISLTFWSARWIREFVFRFMVERTEDMGLRNSVAIFSQYATIILGVLISLRILDIDLTALKVATGALAFGVGLGLRDLFNNFACGFLLLIERPLRVGDTVTINGYEGDVMEIGSRAVILRTADHMDVVVPNAEIFSKSFVNWTSKDSVIRSSATINIHRRDNPEMVQALIYDVLLQHKEILREPAPEVFLKELSDVLVEFEIRYYINLRKVPSRVGLRSEILMQIWNLFEKHGISPPYPQHEVLVASEPLRQ